MKLGVMLRNMGEQSTRETLSACAVAAERTASRELSPSASTGTILAMVRHRANLRVVLSREDR